MRCLVNQIIRSNINRLTHSQTHTHRHVCAVQSKSHKFILPCGGGFNSMWTFIVVFYIACNQHRLFRMPQGKNNNFSAFIFVFSTAFGKIFLNIFKWKNVRKIEVLFSSLSCSFFRLINVKFIVTIMATRDWQVAIMNHLRNDSKNSKQSYQTKQLIEPLSTDVRNFPSGRE